MCEWGYEKPSEWAGLYANSWRTTMDIEDTWASFTKILDA
jgi:alpha-galactosidase